MTAAPRRGRPGYDRTQALDAAVAVFIEQGYDGTSISALAEKLGVTKSALYHHFDSKEAILAEALSVALDGLDTVIAAAEQAPGSALDRLTHAMTEAVRLLVREKASVTLLLRVRGNSATERAALERRRDFDARVAGLVSEAQAAGSVRSDVDARSAARLLFGIVNSVVVWYRGDDAEELARDVVAIGLDGLRVR